MRRVSFELARHPVSMAELRMRYPTASVHQLRHAWLLPVLWSLMWWTLSGSFVLCVGGDLGDMPILMLGAAIPSALALLLIVACAWCVLMTRTLIWHHRFLPRPKATS